MPQRAPRKKALQRSLTATVMSALMWSGPVRACTTPMRKPAVKMKSMGIATGGDDGGAAGGIIGGDGNGGAGGIHGGTGGDGGAGGGVRDNGGATGGNRASMVAVGEVDQPAWAVGVGVVCSPDLDLT